MPPQEYMERSVAVKPDVLREFPVCGSSSWLSASPKLQPTAATLGRPVKLQLVGPSGPNRRRRRRSLKMLITAHAPRVEVGLASRDAMTSSSSGCRERAEMQVTAYHHCQTRRRPLLRHSRRPRGPHPRRHPHIQQARRDRARLRGHQLRRLSGFSQDGRNRPAC
jgi:hypothetical protein